MTQKPYEAEIALPICFVIMPISDAPGYEPGHFARVYEHVMKPAIKTAGYTPVRADDTVKTDYIVVGIIQKLIESEMVVCDQSARNPNVMYELGIRHAFNRPVVMIKDNRTERTFDIQGLRYTEYDSSLRIDTVEKDVAKIVAAIEETKSAAAGTINSVVQLAGIRAAEVPAGQEISPDTKLLLEAINAIGARPSNAKSNDEFQSKNIKFFQINDDTIVFSDGSTATIGEEVYDHRHMEVGTLIDIIPGEEKIFIRSPNQKVHAFSSGSVRTKGCTAMPF